MIDRVVGPSAPAGALRITTVLLGIAVLLGGATASRAEDPSPGPMGFWPATGVEVPLDTPFMWKDVPLFSSYEVRIRRKDTGAYLPYINVGGSDPEVCPGSGWCTLRPGTPGYPALATREYEWRVLARKGTWQSWIPGTFSNFFVMPALSASVGASWNADVLDLTWLPAAGAASYRADIGNVFTKDYTEDYGCPAGPVCSASSDIGHVPFGTMLVALRSCGLHGRCTKTGTAAEAYKPVPTPIDAPNILLPAEGGTVTGPTHLVWQDAANLERWNVRIERDGMILIEESPWRPIANCTLQLCTRDYALEPGSYLLTLSAYAGGVWGPSHTIAFAVLGNAGAPELVTPAPGQVTSVSPLLAWKQMPGFQSYVVSLTGALNADVVVDCPAAICTLDFLERGWTVEGDIAWSVRVDAPGTSASSGAFTASYGYAPPPPAITSPAPNAWLGSAQHATLVFEGDPQVPSFGAQVTGGCSYSLTSPALSRFSADCQLLASGPALKRVCAYTTPPPKPMTCYGIHSARVTAMSPVNESGGSSSVASPRVDFFRSSSASKSIYTLLGQNTQGLPPQADVEKYYSGRSMHQRMAELIQFIRQNDVDVVALSEVFKDEAKSLLGRSLRDAYKTMIGHIDTAGDPLFTVREGFPIEEDSGLAVYSKFPALSVLKLWDSNWQCTSDAFNQVSETYAPDTPTPTPLNDHVWFNQYCEAEGMDAMAAKGMAAVLLQNPRTGIPLLIAWSHTQAQTNQGPLSEAGLPFPNDYSYKDSYRKLDSQLKEAGISLQVLIQQHLQGNNYDAFVFGDWNLPQPPSAGPAPRFDGVDDVPGWVDPNAPAGMYDEGCAVLGCDDPLNPSYADLVGPYDPTPDGWIPRRLYSHYWKAFDPRHDGRYVGGFHDLWLENPAGDFGFTYDPSRNAAARCEEVGEPCHAACAKNPACHDKYGDEYDRGQRYDPVLARLHASNIPFMRRTANSYPGGGWAHSRACVQHTRIVRELANSDHFPTLVEVGPEARYCSPQTAKAAAQDRLSSTAPPGYVPPPDPWKDKYKGLHEGVWTHGGANEWFYITKGGGFDFVNEGGGPFIVEAYDPKDLSTPISVADSTQTTNGLVLGGLCNSGENGRHIADEGKMIPGCLDSTARVTYKHPGPFYARIYPARPGPNGTHVRCLNCVGAYTVRIRERSCRTPEEAALTSSGIRANGVVDMAGWFGEGQRECWFNVELRQPTLADDHQTLTFADLYGANTSRCEAAGGTGDCAASYTGTIFTDEAGTQQAPGGVFMHVNGSSDESFTTNGWSVTPPPSNPFHLKQLKVRVARDGERAHAAVLPWDTDLASVTLVSIRAMNTDDDGKLICLPFPIPFCAPDPFNKADEGHLRVFANGDEQASYEYEFEPGAVYEFPNRWPGSPSDNELREKDGRPNSYDGTAKPSTDQYGFTLNFTTSGRMDMEDEDDDSASDSLIADHVMKDAPEPPAGVDKQTHLVRLYRAQLLDTPGSNRARTETWNFEDDLGVNGRMHYQLTVRVRRDP
jgi:hypothetical protein